MAIFHSMYYKTGLSSTHKHKVRLAGARDLVIRKPNY